MKPKKFSLNKISKKIKNKEAWKPEKVEVVNDSVLNAYRFEGEYEWHKHDDKDEIFIVFKGSMKILTKKGTIHLKEGEGVNMPKGTEFCPVSDKPSIVLMIEPLG
ncbi:cupin domain-containing protein [Candidatus Woesearchaeota archaeon]|nr:cupin domain-containing protein [Candidatus Woesearchaeota archaeon]